MGPNSTLKQQLIRHLDELGEPGSLSYEQRTAPDGPLTPSVVQARRKHTRSNRRLMQGILGVLLAGALLLAASRIFEWTLPGFIAGLVGGGALVAPVLLWRLYQLSKIEALYDLIHTLSTSNHRAGKPMLEAT